MPTKRKKDRITGTHFVWLLGRRNGVYYADGRSNHNGAGRHSLGTKNYQEAVEALRQLDLLQAAELGLIDRSAVALGPAELLMLEAGRQLYLAHVSRARVVGGARPASAKRYRAVLDKFEPFARSEAISAWNQVTRRTLESYA